ncbi:hypothetical protein PUNSTDRAFT_56732 [Punctularia strigosozonata HHB-11173 SS5]|uniref:uncharacterized protein n=1 Tax=Punctularia strigosozonata (strain HHB-11173) TaxID=741275 RepID=UPI00044169C0|nr:uncharacterized protein PUNSTDRAFT_56732 [Punctularia strigosozonata HHB-11173 SS5]EIN13808.1 hypothetical protein PUNSTDRAFT_56732 [Punctularia strigosozonata HHB-11173 SS5]
MQKERGHESLYPVAWALRSKPPLDPLVLCAHDRMLYAFNVKSRQFVAEIRGHGNSITSIAVEATHPSIVCTTSRDFSARIIDLDMEPRQEPNNPPMPPSKVPNLAGAPVGLQMTGREGNGFGRCLAVLAGGRAGGHQAAVMGAAFHHTFPLIATCGMDRAVKIWRLPLLSNPDVFSREDKPIFSSSRIHDARVLSVSWLSDDVLLTHSAPASLRRDPDDVQSLYTQDGQAIVWQWIGLHRFFPPDKGAAAWPNAARPCASVSEGTSAVHRLSLRTA